MTVINVIPGVTLNLLDVLSKISFISFKLQSGFNSFIKATAAVTCGVASDVPVFVSVPPFLKESIHQLPELQQTRFRYTVTFSATTLFLSAEPTPKTLSNAAG